MERTILIDTIPFDVSPDLVNESINSGKPLRVSGILQKSDTKNHNGRIYPRPILERESNKYLNTQVRERRALGELDHPDSQVVNLNNVSHNIVEMYWKGDNLVGVVEVLGTPSGNILKELFRAGIKLGISSRGLGSLKKDNNGSDIVQEDFELVAFDFVSNPSTPGAFMYSNSLNENIDKNIKNKYSNINRIITSILVG